MTIITKCQMCGEAKILEDVDPIAHRKWERKELLAQDAFPDMSPDDRELLISGTCGSCYDKLCGEE